MRKRVPYHKQFEARIDKRGCRDWESAVRRRPSDIEVAELIESHGIDAALERWGHLEPRTIQYMLQRGRRELKSSAA